MGDAVFQIIFTYIYTLKWQDQLVQSIFIFDSLSFNPLFNPYIDSYQLGFVFSRFRSEWYSLGSLIYQLWRFVRVVSKSGR